MYKSSVVSRDRENDITDGGAFAPTVVIQLVSQKNFPQDGDFEHKLYNMFKCPLFAPLASSPSPLDDILRVHSIDPIPSIPE